MVCRDSGVGDYRFAPALADLLAALPPGSLVLIDIPLGLSSPGYPRTVESALRRRVPGRGSTVFNVPCRAAVYAASDGDKAEARRLNREETEKSLSEQSLNICPKIREADSWLRNRAGSLSSGASGPPGLPASPNPLKLYESHPETAFAALKGEVLLSKKSQPPGRAERLSLLSAADPDFPRLYERILKETKRKDVKPDDILDAAALCQIAELGRRRGLDFIRDENSRDECGIEMRIACLESGKDQIQS
jgi:predicted RNase H-like nuclease